MSLKNMSFCHYGYITYLSTQTILNMSLKICIFVILYCILYLYMYEKATIYQWFEEKSLSLQQNQLS